ncbi:hypothetical protein [Butyrivibrio sp. VCB2006]|uniref:hypothetical protein n=1 Tax=Butyrivibrio sp. VCB2006 TaxID=1280679 RepID=UPI00040A2586|nr:hypothetical protein [Butyrivibrio sp. VCB2006]
MKLKYYLRGMGIGIILTAIVMGFALGGRKATISDAEVIERAKSLGMIDGKGVLDSGTVDSEVGLNSDTYTSDPALDQTGEEVSEEINQEFASAGEYISEMGVDAQEGQGEETETGESSEQSSEYTISEDTQVATSSGSDVGTGTDNKTETKTDSNNKASSEDSHQEIQDDETAVVEEIAALGGKTSVTKTITIPGGLGSEGVARVLYNEGIIDNAATFNNYLVERKMDRIIRSGVKTFPAGSTYEDIARIICQG